MAGDKDIAGVVTFFFDHFVDAPGFMSLGYAKNVPDNVQQAVAQALGAYFRKSVLAIELTTAEVPEMQLMHGSVEVNGRAGSLIWAPDIQTGIISIPGKNIKSGEMLHFRFSLTPPGDKRTMN